MPQNIIFVHCKLENTPTADFPANQRDYLSTYAPMNKLSYLQRFDRRERLLEKDETQIKAIIKQSSIYYSK